MPELDEEGKRVKMYDFAAEDLLDRMLKSGSPFVRTTPEPYPFHDKPLVVVAVPLSRVIFDTMPTPVTFRAPARTGSAAQGPPSGRCAC